MSLIGATVPVSPSIECFRLHWAAVIPIEDPVAIIVFIGTSAQVFEAVDDQGNRVALKMGDDSGGGCTLRRFREITAERRPSGISPDETPAEAIFLDPVDGARAEELLLKGDTNKHVGCTERNDKSSRAHTVFRLSIERSHADGAVTASELNIVDLAGSERQSAHARVRPKDAERAMRSQVARGFSP